MVDRNGEENSHGKYKTIRNKALLDQYNSKLALTEESGT